MSVIVVAKCGVLLAEVGIDQMEAEVEVGGHPHGRRTLANQIGPFPRLLPVPFPHSQSLDNSFDFLPHSPRVCNRLFLWTLVINAHRRRWPLIRKDGGGEEEDKEEEEERKDEKKKRKKKYKK
eukprot:GHVT01065804.1.p1 GENE.GHVT01065804.1~~GHVT01065804.1.p1  ORF type:complete len:123 (-),score=18.34 GHVT01065804.1:846-1214(-)